MNEAMKDFAGNDKQFKCPALVHFQLCKDEVENVTCIITQASKKKQNSKKKKHMKNTHVDWSASV